MTLAVGGVWESEIALYRASREAAAVVPGQAGEDADFAQGHRQARRGIVFCVGSYAGDEAAIEWQFAVLFGYDVDYSAGSLGVKLSAGVGDDLYALHAAGRQTVKGIGPREAQ